MSIAGAEFLLTDNSCCIKTVAQVGQPLGVIRGWVDPLRHHRTRLRIPASISSRCAQGKPKGALYIDDGTHDCSQRPGHAMRRQRPSASSATRIRSGRETLTASFRFRKLEFSGLVDIKKGGDVWNGTQGALYSYGTHRDTENRATCTGTHNVDCTGNHHAFGDARFLSGASRRTGRRHANPDRRELVSE